ncbi:NADP-dependent oxidoreductase domain-containing protein [Auriculariales sp. MPI-PUGE-AT-0066]|nr:NADP-dependent oxidoreductase domain-containing protein [Auriculariales sp. MPI-PUGE-AT-0066]
MTKSPSDIGSPLNLPGASAQKSCKCKSRTRGLAVLLVILSAWMLIGPLTGALRTGCSKTAWLNRKLMATKAQEVAKKFTLPSGDVIPGLALGVWQSTPGEVGAAVETALKLGYNHIDGAWIYRNEAEVGAAIVKSGVSRKDLWITSKLWNTFHQPENVESALDDSLAKLGTDYVDLYLMHWPVAQNADRSLDKELSENPFPTWQAMERLVAKGKARNIGVSNFTPRRLANLTANKDIKIIPAINQLVKWAAEHNVILGAYSPLGSNNQVKESLKVPEVVEAANELGITPAQVLLSWQAQRGVSHTHSLWNSTELMMPQVVVLAKSVTASRIEENMHLYELPQHLFDKIEAAAAAHPQKRIVNPSKGWGFDIFDEWTSPELKYMFIASLPQALPGSSPGISKGSMHFSSVLVSAVLTATGELCEVLARREHKVAYIDGETGELGSFLGDVRFLAGWLPRCRFAIARVGLVELLAFGLAAFANLVDLAAGVRGVMAGSAEVAVLEVALLVEGLSNRRHDKLDLVRSPEGGHDFRQCVVSWDYATKGGGEQQDGRPSLRAARSIVDQGPYTDPFDPDSAAALQTHGDQKESRSGPYAGPVNKRPQILGEGSEVVMV